jgi:homopolymeric O-antigen transport system ATP-binding protein
MTTAPTQAADLTSAPPAAHRVDTSTPPAVIANNLGKCFHIYTKPALRLAEWCTLNRVKHHTDFWALRDINLTLAPGSCLGVIGENGSGKSTLVKLLCNTLYPTTGSCSVRGRSLSLMELGTGLNTQLSGRNNVENISRLLGLGERHTRDAMDEIESFAQLGAFFDRPVGVYSAGMRLRLTFSTFAALEPDVLLIDEALSVGDVFFQQKCAARIREMLATGMTLVLVSHDMAAVQNLCDRVLLLRSGEAAFLGEPEEAVSRYLSRTDQPPTGVVRSERTAGRTGSTSMPAAQVQQQETAATLGEQVRAIIAHDIIGVRSNHRHGQGHLRILAARVTNTVATDTLSFITGDDAIITLVVEASESTAQPRAGVRLFDRLGNHVFGAGTAIVGQPLPPLSPGERVIVRFQLTLDLKPGRYTLGMAASTPSDDDDPNTAVFQDSIDMLGPIQVLPPADQRLPFFGLVRLPMTITHEVVRDA